MWRPPWWRSALLAWVACMVLSGCGGYRWVAAEGSGAMAGGQMLAVPPFANDTAEPLLSERITRALRSRLLTGGVTVSGNADMVLKGRLVRFSDDVQAFDANGVASHRRVILTAHILVTRKGKTVWNSPLTVGSAIYAVSGDPTRNRDNKDRAVAEAAAGISEQILLTLGTLEADR